MLSAFFLLAFGAGVALSVQAAINGQLALSLGDNAIAAAAYSFVSGTVILVTLALLRGGLPAVTAAIPAQPAWKLIGGALGASVIFSTVVLAPRIGLANMLALLIAGQLLASLTIDHFGLLGMATRAVSPIRAAGALVMVAGVVLTLFGDKLVAALAGRAS